MANRVQDKARVLVIDDDEVLQGLLREYLARFQMEAVSATDGDEGLRILGHERPDIIVLDVMLPKKDGFEICKSIRGHYDIPIIMLSARGEVTDRIVGLELGADDYMTKPFEPRELVTRINTVLRRSGTVANEEKISCDRLELRIPEREAFLDGASLKLTSMEFELLLLFMRNPNKKLSRDDILGHLVGVDNPGTGRSVDILVSRLRAKLGETPQEARLIKSVHGFGYVFIGQPL